MHVHNEDLILIYLILYTSFKRFTYLMNSCIRNVLPSPSSLENTYRIPIILKSFIYFAYSETTLNISLLPSPKEKNVLLPFISICCVFQRIIFEA